MSVWYVARGAARRAGWQGRAVLAVGILAVALVAAVPVALFAGLLLMLLGHVVVGLALFGGSVLAAVVSVAVAGASGLQYLRGLVRRSLGDVRLYGQGPDGQGPDGQGPGGPDAGEQRGYKVVQLQAEDYRDA